MSLLLSRLSRLCQRKPEPIRSSLFLLSNGFSSSLLQTPPCKIIDAYPCGEDMAIISFFYGWETCDTSSEEKKMPLDLVNKLEEKKVPLDLVKGKGKGMIGASHGWVATVKPDGRVSLQDDLNPVASETYPKRISLPPFKTLPDCQTQIITGMAMSSSSPEDEDCVVAFKFMGPQLSFCKPARTNPEWINIKIQNSCFFSSPVMFSKKDDMFRIPGSGGHLIGSWDLHKHSHNPKIQKLQFRNFPKLTQKKIELLDSCSRSEHLVESRTTGETFLVKLYKKAITGSKKIKMMTTAIMVFKLDEEGNAVYTEDIGDLAFYLSKAESFAVRASSFPSCLRKNWVELSDVDQSDIFYLPWFLSYPGQEEWDCPDEVPYFIGNLVDNAISVHKIYEIAITQLVF